MSVRERGRFDGFARELADGAAKRLWTLWLIPAAGLAARRLIGGVLERGSGPVASSVLLGLLVTLAAAAAFAEVWIGEGGRLDARRLFMALALFLLPYPALALAGWIMARILEQFVLHSQEGGAGLTAVVAVDLVLSKILSMGITLWSALAFARWRRGQGALETLLAGGRVLRANLAFAAVLGLSTWGAQEALSAVFALGRHAAAGASPEAFALIGVVSDYLMAAAPLVGCVGAPLAAFKSGRLAQP